MKYIFPAVIRPNEDLTRFEAEVPDLHSCITSGATLSEAIDMVSDAAACCLCVMEDEGVPISDPTPQHLIPHETGDYLTLIQLDTIAYRKATDSRAVRKNVSLPAWMARLADENGLNCSQILQEALALRFNAL